jgi:Tol biopolymer transport system component
MSKFVLLLKLGLGVSAMAKDVMLMNRIGPSKSELYVASADGSGEHKLLNSSGFDYHASYSYDGKWIVFTSERNGYGQADIYRVHPDGTGLERLTDDPALDDQGVLSPDGNQFAFVSTRATHRASIWILDLKTKQLRNLERGWQVHHVEQRRVWIQR